MTPMTSSQSTTTKASLLHEKATELTVTMLRISSDIMDLEKTPMDKRADKLRDIRENIRQLDSRLDAVSTLALFPK
jgi:hypothetical protein